jgi:hypothetical protein
MINADTLERGSIVKFIGVKLERAGDLSDFVEFGIDEVNYISVYRPQKKSYHIPIYHTSHGSYAPLMTLRDLSQALTPRGFKHIDKSTIINTSRVKHMIKGELGLKIIFKDMTQTEVASRRKYK